VKCLHGLLDRSVGVESVDLKKVDVIGIETFQASVHGAEDGTTRKTALVDVVLAFCQIGVNPDAWLFTKCCETFRENHHLLARDVVFLECLADDGF